MKAKVPMKKFVANGYTIARDGFYVPGDNAILQNLPIPYKIYFDPIEYCLVCYANTKPHNMPLAGIYWEAKP